MSFLVTDLYWNPRRIQSTPAEIEAAVACLNTLSVEQEKAVRVYGRSCKEEGYDEGYDGN